VLGNFCSDIRTNCLKALLKGCKLEKAVRGVPRRFVQDSERCPENNFLGISYNNQDGEPMDVLKMLADLRQEREQIEEAIVTLERLAQGRGRRRGRPPAWMSALKRRGRPPGSKNKSKDSAAAA
jgi:hypothetical protein